MMLTQVGGDESHEETEDIVITTLKSEIKFLDKRELMLSYYKVR